MKNLFLKLHKGTKEKGFTLVETLVAISILALSITGPMFIAQRGIQSSIYARDEITAFYLAQEAIEYVRSVRDSNRSGSSWLANLTPCLSGSTCKIDSRYLDYISNPMAITSCTGTCPVLAFDTSNRLYGYGSGGSWQNTVFRRAISISEIVPSTEAIVSVTISWTTGLFSTERSFTVSEHIFNF